MRARTPAQLAALASARAKREIASERTPPEGWRSVDHLLDDTREFLARHSGLTLELARYLGVSEKSVRRWVKREKMPMQETIDTIARWRRVKAIRIRNDAESVENIKKLIDRWRKDADQYMRQVEEARAAGTPHDQMLSMSIALRQCAKESEAAQSE